MKITPIKSEVKKVSDMSIEEMYNYQGVDYKFPSEDMLIRYFFKMYESQFGTYNENDYIILHTVEVEL